MYSKERACEALRAAGVDVNGKNRAGCTPLMVASQFRDLKNMKLLLVAGADTEIESDIGRTALHMAVGDNMCVDMLVNYSADVHARDNTGWTPLHLAVVGGYVECTKTLMVAGSDAFERDNEGYSPFYITHHCTVLSERADDAQVDDTLGLDVRTCGRVISMFLDEKLYEHFKGRTNKIPTEIEYLDNITTMACFDGVSICISAVVICLELNLTITDELLLHLQCSVFASKVAALAKLHGGRVQTKDPKLIEMMDYVFRSTETFDCWEEHAKFLEYKAVVAHLHVDNPSVEYFMRKRNGGPSAPAATPAAKAAESAAAEAAENAERAAAAARRRADAAAAELIAEEDAEKAAVAQRAERNAARNQRRREARLRKEDAPIAPAPVAVWPPPPPLEPRPPPSATRIEKKAAAQLKARKRAARRGAASAPAPVPAAPPAPEPVPAAPPASESVAASPVAPVVTSFDRWIDAMHSTPVAPPPSLEEILAQKLAIAEARAAELQRRADDRLCTICMDAERSRALDPCGHTLCAACAVGVSRCPECRADVARTIHVYI